MNQDAVRAAVTAIITALESHTALTATDYASLRLELDALGGDPDLPIRVREIIETASIVLWALSNESRGAADSRRAELRWRLLRDLAALKDSLSAG